MLQCSGMSQYFPLPVVIQNYTKNVHSNLFNVSPGAIYNNQKYSLFKTDHHIYFVSYIVTLQLSFSKNCEIWRFLKTRNDNRIWYISIEDKNIFSKSYRYRIRYTVSMLHYCKLTGIEVIM